MSGNFLAIIQTAQIFHHQGDDAAAKAWLPTSGLSAVAQQKVIGGH
jgi:hypothetical protein